MKKLAELFENKQFLIVHKLERGDIDLQIADASEKLELLQELISDEKVEITKAGKSASIMLKVDSIDRFASFESQKNIAIKGMEAAVILLEIGKKLKNKI